MVKIDHNKPPDIAEYKRLLLHERTSPEQQVEAWLRLWHEYPDTVWGEQCIKEAEQVMNLIRREQELRNQLLAAQQPTTSSAATLPISMQKRHFVWLGNDVGLNAEQVRTAIDTLSKGGLIMNERDQQEALRRGLGLCVNEAERTTDAPWVVWIGPADMLWLLVERLWEMGLITCAGGLRQKWRTASGMFVRPDGTCFGPNLKNSRCTNAKKIALLEKGFLATLRFYMKK